MRKSTRLFELIQILRAARRPVTADELAERLGVSARTVYRDIAALQAMRTPIDGEAGLGYVMRRGYDLPPLNFDQEELEALRVGLALLSRTGDSALVAAAGRIGKKIDALQDPVDWLKVAAPGAPLDDPDKGCVSKALLRGAIRDERKIEITYRDEKDAETTRILRPVALLYYQDCAVLAAWCELRRGFRCFRADRIWACTLLDDTFPGEGPALRRLWEDSDTSFIPFVTAF
ncbi:helix-turn-helix transcriptional regulator [Marinibacterium sp. SX1]|uniref:helix-turn-helix transcriptional regulator n=1 Tax=Marinibacterium sp. SX1 TaxID=3388424 RepID=UPI003D17C427